MILPFIHLTNCTDFIGWDLESFAHCAIIPSFSTGSKLDHLVARLNLSVLQGNIGLVDINTIITSHELHSCVYRFI